MTQVQNGQCGLGAHFGENHPQDSKIIQIRLKHEAPDGLVEECGHPEQAPLHPMVTPISGCAGFLPAPEPMSARG